MTDKSMQVINSNDLSALSEICSRIIRSHESNNDDPFAPEFIITMNKGMKTYLQQSLAESNSVCANLNFCQVWEFIWHLHKTLNGADSANRYSHEHMTWSIFSIISNLREDDSIFVKMRDYVKVDKDREMSYQLCGVIADSFDQYQMYRPDWIVQWNEFTEGDFDAVVFEDDELKGSGRVFEFIKKVSKGSRNIQRNLFSNLWQIKLWTMLKHNLAAPEQENDPSLWDRASVVSSLTQSFIRAASGESAADSLIEKLPKRLFIFGVSSLPTQVIELFKALGRLIPVFFMHLNPCREYWGDLTSVKNNWASEKKKIVKYLEGRSFSRSVNLRDFDGRRVCARIDGSSFDNGGEKSFLELYDDVCAADTDLEPAQADADAYAQLVDGNPMLLSLGKEGRDTLNVLLDTGISGSEVNFTNIFFEHEDDCVLNHIKNQLLNLKYDEHKKFKIAPDDDSLQIKICYTMVREVEALRDRMLSLFKKDPSLRPVDMLVMVPDIELYAPYIESVFGAVENSLEQTSSNYIPYAVCDKTGRASSPIADALIELLSIGSSKVSANLIIELLSVAPIARKFRFDAEDLSVIASWFKDNCVHWGIDDADVKDILSTQDSLNLPWTLEEGIDRLLQGFMLGNALHSEGFDNFATTDFSVLSRLCAFLESLKLLKDTFYPNLDLGTSGEYTNLEWSNKLNEVLIRNFFVIDESSENEIRAIEDILSEMNESINNLKCSQTEQTDNDGSGLRSSLKIKLPVFRAKLIHALGNTRDSSAYLRGKVNFCSLMPMRAVPFKYIFILGLKDTDFPRTDTYPSFNLLSVKALMRRNDRARASDDRFIFLESFLSAKKGLYLSYIGRSANDKSELNPSAVITELYDYLSDNFCVDESIACDDEKNRASVLARLTKTETLSAYDPRNFIVNEDPGNKYERSFNEALFFDPNEEGVETRGDSPLANIVEDLDFELPEELNFSIDDLVDFFVKPCKAFLKQRLNISLYTDSGFDIEDKEPFEVGSLQMNRYISELFGNLTDKSEAAGNASLLNEKIMSDEIDLMGRKGMLPYGVLFDETKEKLSASVLELYDKLGMDSIPDNFDQKEYKRVLTDFEYEGKRIRVSFEGKFKSHSNILIDFYHVKPSEIESASRLIVRALFTRLAYNYAKGVSAADEIKIYTKTGEIYSAPLLCLSNIRSSKDSDEILKRAVSLYLAALRTPVPVTSGLYKSVIKALKPKSARSGAACTSVYDAVALADTDTVFEYNDEAKYLFSCSNLFSLPEDGGQITEKSRALTCEFVSFILENTIGTGE